MTDDSREPSFPLLPWWQEWEGRLEAELDRFDTLGFKVTVTEDPRKGASRLVVETMLDLPEPDGTTRVVVVYPDGFPHRRFAVRAPDLKLGRHQAPSGDLCVFPRGDRFWHPACLAADSIATDVPRLVRLVHAGGDALREAEDPQGEPFTTYYGGSPLGGIVIDEGALSINPSDGDSGSMTVVFAGHDNSWLTPPDPQPDGWNPPVGQGLLTGITTADGTPLMAQPAPRLTGRFGVVAEGRWVYMAQAPRVESAEALWDAIVDTSPEVLRWVNGTSGFQLIGLCTHDEVQQDVYEPAWVFLARTVTKQPEKNKRRSGNPANRQLTRATAPTIVRSLRWTPDDLAARIPELHPMRTATVTVIGLGSLGAPLVQELVKSRTGHLRLSDFDYIDPGTSVRYPLGLEHAGIDKGLALGRWAQAHNPEVIVDLMNCMIGDAPADVPTKSERETIHDLLNGTDLMVSATAESDVNRQLDLAALRMGVPRLFLWSQSGYGGIVALLRPGATGCFHCLSLYISRRSEAGDHVVNVPPDEDGQVAGTIQGYGCGDKTFSAHHADLLPLSIQAARVAYGHLCGPHGGYPAFTDDVFAVQVREADGQPIPPRWTSFKLPTDPECSICHPA